MKYFKLEEFNCKCCGLNDIDIDLVIKLEAARIHAGTPFKINSGYRCEDHNAYVGGKTHSAHTKGLAADILCPNSGARFKILTGLILAGCTRIGVAETFIHVDVDPGKPQEVIWTY